MFGNAHDMEWELAEEICNRFPVEMCRFGKQRHGSDDARRPPGPRRDGTRQDREVEGAYHGLHDSALVSVKPHAPDYGDINAPTPVPGG